MNNIVIRFLVIIKESVMMKVMNFKFLPPIGGNLTVGTRKFRVTDVDANVNEDSQEDATVSATHESNLNNFHAQSKEAAEIINDLENDNWRKTT